MHTKKKKGSHDACVSIANYLFRRLVRVALIFFSPIQARPDTGSRLHVSCVYISIIFLLQAIYPSNPSIDTLSSLLLLSVHPSHLQFVIDLVMIRAARERGRNSMLKRLVYSFVRSTVSKQTCTRPRSAHRGCGGVEERSLGFHHQNVKTPCIYNKGLSENSDNRNCLVSHRNMNPKQV